MQKTAWTAFPCLWLPGAWLRPAWAGPADAAQPAVCSRQHVRVPPVLKQFVLPVLQVHVAQYFVEDRGPSTPSYADFMVMVHKGVMSKA